MAELYPIPIVELWSIVIHCCRFSRKIVGSQSDLSITSPKSPETCRLECRFLCSMIGYSELKIVIKEMEKKVRIRKNNKYCTSKQ